MIRIKDYLGFLLLESHLVVDPDFTNIIKSIAKKNATAGNLFRFFNKKMETNVNYLSVGKKNDEVSFTNDKQIDRILQSGDDPFLKGRGSSKIGRVVRQILLTNGIQSTDKEIEDFVNAYKIEWDLLNSPGNFEIVKGDEIKYWYNESKYVPGGGTLNGSCMRYNKCANFLDIYAKNPNQCQLVILKSQDGESLLGRALLWTCEDGTIYLDRVYTTFDYDEKKIINWTKEQFQGKKFLNWKDNPNIDQISVKPTIIEHNQYPYMDSLNSINITKGVLTYEPDNKDDLFFLAKATDGGKEVYNFGYSKVHNKYIKNGEYKHIIQINDNVYLNECLLDIKGNFIYKPRAIYCPIYDGYCDLSNAMETKWGKVPNYEIVSVLIDAKTGKHEEMPKIALGNKYVGALDASFRLKYVPIELAFNDIIGNWYLLEFKEKFFMPTQNINYIIINVVQVDKEGLQPIGDPQQSFGSTVFINARNNQHRMCQVWALEGTNLPIGVEYLFDGADKGIFCEDKLANALGLKKINEKYSKKRNLYWDTYDKNPIVEISKKIKSSKLNESLHNKAILELTKIDEFMSRHSNTYNLNKGSLVISNISNEDRIRMYNNIHMEKWLKSNAFKRSILNFEKNILDTKNSHTLSIMTGYFNRMRPFGVNRRYTAPEFIEWFKQNIEKIICSLYIWSVTYDRVGAAHMTSIIYNSVSSNTTNWLTQYTYSQNSSSFGDDIYNTAEEIEYGQDDGYDGYLSRWARNNFLQNRADDGDYSFYNNALHGWNMFKEENLPEILKKFNF